MALVQGFLEVGFQIFNSFPLLHLQDGISVNPILFVDNVSFSLYCAMKEVAFFYVNLSKSVQSFFNNESLMESCLHLIDVYKNLKRKIK